MAQNRLKKFVKSFLPLNLLEPASKKHVSKKRSRLNLLSLEDRLVPTGSWSFVKNPVPDGDAAQTAIILSNGSVLVKGGGDSATTAYYELTPDNTGSYINGTWSVVGSMNDPRLFASSVVLQNSQVLTVGGEYPDFQNTAEVFNPVTQSWTLVPSVPTPDGGFGDDPLSVLPNGNVLAGYYNGPQTYIYNPTTNTWTNGPNKLDNDPSDEESWVKLANGDILSYSIFSSINDNVGEAQYYDPTKNEWFETGTLPALLSTPNEGYELGPALLMDDGRAIFFGTHSNTAIYDPTTNTWSAGPDIPNGYTMSDAPGAIMPNGNILIATSPVDTDDSFPSPTVIYELNTQTMTYTDVTPSGFGLDSLPSFTENMLVLPTGQVMMVNDSGTVAIYTPDGTPDPAGTPTITGITKTGGVLTLTGTKLTGLNEGAAYGDDDEMSSNYPLVQLTDMNGNVHYGYTYNWSSTQVQTGNLPITTNFSIPSNLTGAYLLSSVVQGQTSNSFLYVQPGAGANNLTVEIDPSDSTKIEILQGNTEVGLFDLNSFSQIYVNGATGNNLNTTVSISEAVAALGVPINIYGSTGTNNHLTLKLEGTSSSDSFVSGANSASIDGYSINFTGVTSVVFDGNGGNDSFDITPLSTISFTANGGGTGSTLLYHGAATLTLTGYSSGTILTNGLLSDSYTGIGTSITITGNINLNVTAGVSSTNGANNGVADNFVITGSNSGTSILINGSGLPSIIGNIVALGVIGSNDNDTVTVDNSQAAVNLPISFNGGGGNNTLNVIGAATSDNFVVNNSQVKIDSTTINYANVQTMQLTGNGGSDNFDVTPLAITAINITGSDSGTSTTNTLTYRGSGTYTITGNDSATISSPGLQNVTFTGIGGTTTFAGSYSLGISALASASNGPNNGVPDSFYVVKTLTGLQILINGVSSPNILGTLNGVIVTGSNDNDTLSVDNSGGLITAPITFNGGGGSNTLNVIGNSGQVIKRETVLLTPGGVSTLTYDPTDSAGVGATGTLSPNSLVISFNNVLNVVDTTAAQETDYYGSVGADQIDLTNGAAAFGAQTLQIQNLGDSSPVVSLANKGTLTVNGLGGGDSFLVNTTQGATGLSTLDIYGNHLPGLAGADGSETNNFSVIATSAALTTSINGQGIDDTFTLGDTGGSNSISGILGALSLIGGGTDPTVTSGYTVNGNSISLITGNILTVNDGNSSGNLAYTLTPTSLSRNGLGAISFSSIGTLQMTAGTGSDSIQVSNTGDNTATIVHGGTGSDNITVASTGVGSYLDVTNAGSGGNNTINLQAEGLNGLIQLTGGARNDTFNVGSTSNNLNSILGVLGINGGGNLAAPTSSLTVGTVTNTYAVGDTLNLNDSGDLGTTYGISGTAITLPGLNPIGYTSIGTLNLLAGSTTDTVNVASIASNATTTIITGAAADNINISGTGSSGNLIVSAGAGKNVFNVTGTGAGSLVSLQNSTTGSTDQFNVGTSGNSLSGIQGALGLSATAGTNAVSLNDQGDGGNNTYLLKPNSLSWNGGPNIVFQGVQTILLNGSAGSDTYNVNGTTAGSTTTLNDGAGASTFNVQGAGLAGNNILLGNGGGDTFNVNAGTGITATSVSISGGESNSVLSYLNVNGTNGNDNASLHLGSGSYGEQFLGLGSTPLNFDTIGDVTFNGATGAANSNSFTLYSLNNTQFGSTTGVGFNLASGIIYRPISATSGDVRLNINNAGVPVNPSLTPTIHFQNVNKSFTIDGGTNPAGSRDTVTVLGVSTTGLASTPYNETTATNGSNQIKVTDSEVDITNATLGVLRSVKLDTATLQNLVVRAGNQTSGLVGDTVSVVPSKLINILVDGMDPKSQIGGDTINPLTTGSRTLTKITTAALGGSQTRVTQSNGASFGYVNFEHVSGTGIIVTGGDAGNYSLVNVYSATNPGGAPKFVLEPYDNLFKGGTQVAVGDVNGDGIPDIITLNGTGADPHVEVFDGLTGALLQSYIAFTNYLGPTTLAVGDVNGDGYADIIIGTGPGTAPHIKVFSGKDGTLLDSFYAFSTSFLGGISVAAGDINGDGKADIVVGSGAGTQAHVVVFSGADLSILKSYYAFAPTYLGGINVAVGDVNGDGVPDIIVAAATGTSGHVMAFDGVTDNVLASFLTSFPASSGGSDVSSTTPLNGVRIATADETGTGIDDILVSRSQSSLVLSYRVSPTFGQLPTFDTGFTFGVFIGGG